jgi:hypothetical protein
VKRKSRTVLPVAYVVHLKEPKNVLARDLAVADCRRVRALSSRALEDKALEVRLEWREDGKEKAVSCGNRV